MFETLLQNTKTNNGISIRNTDTRARAAQTVLLADYLIHSSKSLFFLLTNLFFNPFASSWLMHFCTTKKAAVQVEYWWKFGIFSSTFLTMHALSFAFFLAWSRCIALLCPLSNVVVEQRCVVCCLAVATFGCKLCILHLCNNEYNFDAVATCRIQRIRKF